MQYMWDVTEGDLVNCPKTALSENLVHPSERTVEPF